MVKPKPRDSVTFVTGARGSGKSSWLKQYARGFGRVLVWDPMHEYGAALGVAPVTSPTELVARRHADLVLVFTPELVNA